MKTRKLLMVGVLGVAVLGTSIAVALGGEGGNVKTVAEVRGILAVMKALEARVTLDPASVGAALDADVVKDAAQDNDAFTFFTGRPKSRGPMAAVVDRVELRMPNAGTAAKGPFVYVELGKGAQATMPDVVAAFGRATTLDVPRPNPEKSMVLVYRTPRGELRFGIGVGPDQRVVSATIDRTE